jgi:REP element-mobilizing transposase RayT
MRWLMGEPIPLAYLITFTCYGTRLHGDPRGSVDRRHNRPGAPPVRPNPLRERFERRRLVEAPYLLDARRRGVVLAAIRWQCGQRGWVLSAAHVRSNHAHLVVSVEDTSRGRISPAIKGAASRALDQLGLDAGRRRRWTTGASARPLWTARAVAAAVHYVVHEQGAAMAVYVVEEQGSGVP